MSDDLKTEVYRAGVRVDDDAVTVGQMQQLGEWIAADGFFWVEGTTLALNVTTVNSESLNDNLEFVTKGDIRRALLWDIEAHKSPVDGRVTDEEARRRLAGLRNVLAEVLAAIDKSTA